jgi:putative oxidoreductase
MKMMCEGLLTFIGRACLAAVFVVTAVNDIRNSEGNTAMIKSIVQGPNAVFQAPDAAIPILRWANITFRLAGAALLVVGLWARLGALLIMLFLIPATVLVHTFWNDPKQLTSFLLNLAIFGGLLLVLAGGPGMCSLDHWRSAKKIEPE